MNCDKCKKILVDYIEKLPGVDAAQVESHLQQCPACQAEHNALLNLTAKLEQSLQLEMNNPMEDLIMEKISSRQVKKSRKLQMSKKIKVISIGAATLASTSIAACIIIFTLLGYGSGKSASASEIMAVGAAKAIELQTIHIKCRMRTNPRDNFSLIGSKFDFVDLDIWRAFGEKPLFRIEKSGRMLICDGESLIMLIRAGKPYYGFKAPAGTSVDNGTGFDAGWLLELTDISEILTSQLKASMSGESEMFVRYEDQDAQTKSIVTVETTADLAGEYLRNKYIAISDSSREFQFDAESGMLEAMRIILHEPQGDSMVFEITDIKYNLPLAADVFQPELPEDIIWYKEPAKLDNNDKYAAMTQKQVAEVFFNACANNDWEEAAKFITLPPNDNLKRFLGGIKIISIGEPFQSSPYPGWFVPYEIQLSSGETRKHNLAIRNYNNAGRWMIDGGL